MACFKCMVYYDFSVVWDIMIGLIFGLRCVCGWGHIKSLLFAEYGAKLFIACMMVNNTVKPPKVGLVKTINLERWALRNLNY